MPIPSDSSLKQTLTVAEFVARWKASSLTERSAAQSHFLDLCDMLGQEHPATADQTGETYTFEKGASKVEGGEGFADVWKRGSFGWEYKGKRKNLSDAYSQLLQYREDLENPPLLVVCDMERFEVHTNFTGTPKDVYRFRLDDLLTNAPTADCKLPPLEVLRTLFTDPGRFKPQRTAEQVTEEAASQFAKLSESLRARGHDPERAAHFLMRLLFCLFAEDIGLLPKELFKRLVESTRMRPGEFQKRLQELFGAMATGGAFGVEDIAYFNGGLFSDKTVLDLSTEDLSILHKAATLDWASVEPAIFGTLFERSLDPSKRSQIGAHYTSRDDILLVVEPTLMAPLRKRWTEVQTRGQEIIAKRDAAKAAAVRTKQERALRELLLGFADELSQVRVLDPACGSGNFLYVALKLLLDLEKEVSVFAFANGLSGILPRTSPSQLLGIEINIYAHELASVVVWIGYIQWFRDNGFGFDTSPILKPLHNIEHRDAILECNAKGVLREPDWPKADVIIGNPPFLGDKKMRAELGDKYVEGLRSLYAGRIPGQSDLACYWFEKARAEIEGGKVKRAGLLGTQGIRGGANRKVLERIKNTGEIFWAISDHDWVLDGANVHVSMVGFDSGKEEGRTLDGKTVSGINSDLTSGVDLTTARQLTENAGLSFIGTQKTGPFDLSAPEAEAMISQSGNPNGKPNSDVVKPWINALDVTQRPRNMWVIDFGIDMPLTEAAEYEAPFEYVKKNVKPVRDSVRRKNHREKWWLFGEARPGLRKTISGLNRYIATPLVSKHRIFCWVPAGVVAENLLVVVARDDDYFFGILQSRVHELWARSVATQLREAESGTRYTPTTTFEAFPFPWPPGKEPTNDARVKAIADATKELVTKREVWLNHEGVAAAELKRRTLTNLYNQRPTWLSEVHRKLDEAVLAAYGWQGALVEEEILGKLLALNHARAATS